MSPAAGLSPVDAAKALAQVPLFESLDPEDRAGLLAVSTVRRLPARKRLFRRGEPGRELFVLLRGRAKVAASTQEGRGAVFDYFEPGDVVGEIALLDGGPRTATVTTVSTCDFLVLARDHFLALLEREPRVAIRLLAACAERLRHTSELVEDVVFLGLPARLAKRLLHLGKEYGVETGAGLRINLKLSQRELGELIGATRESVNRQIGHWEAEHVLRFESGYITLLRPQALAALAALVVA